MPQVIPKYIPEGVMEHNDIDQASENQAETIKSSKDNQLEQ